MTPRKYGWLRSERYPIEQVVNCKPQDMVAENSDQLVSAYHSREVRAGWTG